MLGLFSRQYIFNMYILNRKEQRYIPSGGNVTMIDRVGGTQEYTLSSIILHTVSIHLTVVVPKMTEVSFSLFRVTLCEAVILFV